MKIAGIAVSTPKIARRTTKALLKSWLPAAMILGCSCIACAQDPADKNDSARPPAPAVTSLDLMGPPDLKSLPRNIFQDQKSFWLTPFHMTKQQWRWTVPLAFVGAGLLASDTAIEQHVPTNPTTVSHATTASNAGLALMVGTGAGMFLWGHIAHNEDQRETGLLAGEAAIDAALVTQVLKYSLGRDRPFAGDGRGRFFQGGSSFPSDHASVSWAIASVIAHEYPGPVTQVLVYGLAGSVSAARFVGQKHFASDIVIGSALGWYTGRQVFRAHSRYNSADIAKWGTFSQGEEDALGRDPGNMGSSYVALDSWVYPAFDRLVASGYINDRTISLRPWSRLECARILSEAHQHLEDDQNSSDEYVLSLLRDLDLEFAAETELRKGDTPNINAELESVYSRYTYISGPPLRDAFHFGQTISDDFGRPYGRGSNNITGFTANAAAGPFTIYVRGEYQYGSAGQEYTPEQAQSIAASDQLPLNSVPTFGRTSRPKFVEVYAGLNLADWQFTFGQQSLWWGANRSTSILFSNNAQALPMLRVERVSPMRWPSVLRLLGPVTVSGFLARMGGTKYLRLGPDFEQFGDGIHNVDPQPFLWGANIAFKPTQNLELGFSITSIFAGHGRPLTIRTFLHTFSQRGNIQPVDPGGRRPTMSASYRLPGFRNSVQVYADWLASAQPLPLLYPKESGLSAGMYISHMPRIKNLDLRCEGIYTNMPGNPINNLFYVNFHYPNGYRNYGQLMGSWVGRGGNGGEASATYWFSARNKGTISYRRMISNPSLLGGGNLHDVFATAVWMPRPQFEVAASVQYERWNFVALDKGPDSNVSTTIEIRLWPKLRTAANAIANGNVHP